MWRLNGGVLLEGCLWAFEAAFCLPTDHKYVGEELILGEAERVNCVYACSVSEETRKCWETFTTGLFSADKNANFPFLTYQFRGDKPSVWQVLIYQGDTTGLRGQSQTKIVTIDCQEAGHTGAPR